MNLEEEYAWIMQRHINSLEFHLERMVQGDDDFGHEWLQSSMHYVERSAMTYKEKKQNGYR